MKEINFCLFGTTFTSDFSVSELNPDGVTFIHARLTIAKILDEGKKNFVGLALPLPRIFQFLNATQTA